RLAPNLAHCTATPTCPCPKGAASLSPTSPTPRQGRDDSPRVAATHVLPAPQTLRINVCYWKEKVPGAYGVSANFPCFLALCAPHHIYGLPSNEYPGLVKICCHSGSPADPEERDRPPEASALPDIQILQDFVSKYLPGLVPEPAVVEHCMYTVRGRRWAQELPSQSLPAHVGTPCLELVLAPSPPVPNLPAPTPLPGPEPRSPRSQAAWPLLRHLLPGHASHGW
uniref:Uncharacterized protein n=1 Tax=Terrapene triunguis TaxID=2587831 RepID=A0A674J7H2_9SAUR